MRPLKYSIISVLLCLTFDQVMAQEKFVLSEDQELAVLGTSTLHNWEMVTSSAKGTGLFIIENSKIVEVSDLAVSFAAESLESGRGFIMDRNARRALKSESNPDISFKLERLEKVNESGFTAVGSLTAAGVSREISFDISYTVSEANRIELTGSSSFKLTDFDVEPPVALAGTLHTGDAVSVEFVLTFIKSEKQPGS